MCVLLSVDQFCLLGWIAFSKDVENYANLDEMGQAKTDKTGTLGKKDILEVLMEQRGSGNQQKIEEGKGQLDEDGQQI